MRVEMNTLTASLFLDLYASVDWELPCKEQVEAALQNTLITFTAYEDNQAVGMVRLLGDDGMSFYVKDFAVIPNRQRQGIGSALMSAIREYIISHIQPGWAVSLELISTKEAVSFYKRQGFEERPCDWDGPGMFKMIWNIGDAKHAGD